MKTFKSEDRSEYEELWKKYKMSALQSWNWSEVKAAPSEIVRLKVGSYPMTIIIKTVPLLGWKFGYVPHGGPAAIFTSSTAKELQAIAKKYDLSHILIDPFVIKSDFPKLPSGMELSGEPWIQSQHTIVSNLLDSDDEMMARMSKTHRQNVRKSVRKGLIFETDDSEEGVKRYGEVTKDQVTSKNYLSYSTDYFLKIWRAYEGTNRVHIYLARDGKQDVGGQFVIDGTDTSFQFFGVATSAGRDKYAAYLLTFYSMLATRDNGIQYYDQWGTSPYDGKNFDSTDEKYGISLFKNGFIGEKITYQGQLAIVNNRSRYNVYKNLMSLHRTYISARKKLS